MSDEKEMGGAMPPAAIGDVIATERRGDAVVGLARFRADAPLVRTVADAEALFGRGAAVIGARGGVAECLAAEAPSVVSVPASRFVVDNRPPPVDLAAENAALREALAASGELLAEAHAEIDRLRGER